MKNIEHEGRFAPQMETGDQEGTYEQKNTGDTSNNTVYNGNSNNSSIFIHQKPKKKSIEKVLFTE